MLKDFEAEPETEREAQAMCLKHPEPRPPPSPPLDRHEDTSNIHLRLNSESRKHNRIKQGDKLQILAHCTHWLGSLSCRRRFLHLSKPLGLHQRPLAPSSLLSASRFRFRFRFRFCLTHESSKLIHFRAQPQPPLGYNTNFRAYLSLEIRPWIRRRPPLIFSDKYRPTDLPA
ncbi:hypothetical protein MBM_02056 [Drepanopeziza brunnea f. sp. 'multigermtubi' MB_m1]|uniref:Uncharacterized protein n=1 Tax=Marssonina brunnea f. sp. multigermtubi (strain MB_m1) TaxID=1072389 RepID=K1Y4N2_MARBU|nr:uncharacterized protein MBM_02056 [Drepanopeziza brunnea f. sp. 'multigermtubi' MB_m1]EKD20104.1 hypothetical protein MBM_02056 [Drepanopeziza brunnea f. sp. 'multigermtubi' MB_m1]